MHQPTDQNIYGGIYTQLCVYVITLFSSLYLSVYPKDILAVSFVIKTQCIYHITCSTLEPLSLLVIKIVKTGDWNNWVLREVFPTWEPGTISHLNLQHITVGTLDTRPLNPVITVIVIWKYQLSKQNTCTYHVRLKDQYLRR